VLILKVEDEAGQPLSGAQVSVTLPNVVFTAEIPTDERGEISLLGVAGRYSVSVAVNGIVETPGTDDARFNVCRHSPRIREQFEIRPSDSGERVVVIRMGRVTP
jgi:hypothetical protein